MAEIWNYIAADNVSETPVLPSQRLGRSISEELEHAVMACLEGNCAKRPQTARMLMQMLSKSPAYSQWSWEQADPWWGRQERGVNPNQSSPSNTAPPVHERTKVGAGEGEM